ncbi:hypothetical protein KI387_026091 [Taxus chinensis]|uniref:Protein kinase domain-containing protein n=1 Tax=Taxus chinensis TaxID=29808 RepID=A0AA38FV58_TAXCH|nr:hypothetical protein KI387_026091 [Taxus chinensis]
MTAGKMKWVHLPRPLQCLFVVAAFLCFSLRSSALTPEGLALLEFKAKLIDTKNVLRNWNESDTSPCGWSGVTCNRFSKRVTALNLPYLLLGGTISPSVGKLKKLHRLALHENRLHGFIPPEIGTCRELRALYLRDNYLEGEVPAELGNLTHLMILDLSSNTLKGTIPPSIGKLGMLRFLNLSTNFFAGEIPKTGVMGGFTNISFTGNLDLCGLQVQKLCKDTLDFPAMVPETGSGVANGDHGGSVGVVKQGSSRTLARYLNGLLIGAMVTMGVILTVILVFLWVCFLHKKGVNEEYTKIEQLPKPQPERKLVTFHGDLPYTSQEIIKRIEMLDESNIIGSGGFGTVYKLVMGENSAFAVKKIDKCGVASNRQFERELEILGSIKHRNLVNLRGYCVFPSAKMLIYDYLLLGSLDEFLHDCKQPASSLNWNTRLKIALGAGRGLAYLHHDCYPRIVHRDIKASNILIDEKLEAHVSDFGLAKLLEDEETHVTTVIAGTFGYLAPEYLQSGRATEKSDVYSFGVVLLELLSGKRPTDPSFVKEGLNLVGWVNTLMTDHRLEEIVDPKCEYIPLDSIESFLEIATSCVAPSSEERPTMSKVVQMLEEETMPPCSRESCPTMSRVVQILEEETMASEFYDLVL